MGMSALASTLLRTIQRFNLLLPGEKAVIAISGGADSMALLYLFRDITPLLKVNLHVATFDHRLRETSSEVVKHVQQTATTLDFAVHTGGTDVSAFANMQGMSIETAARQKRYEFLKTVAHDVGASKIITAHHADDQAETILMHLFRGSGLNGLRGMSYKAPFPKDNNLSLIRPLLDVTKAELIDYCEHNDIVWDDDESNQDQTFTRNYMRHSILPTIERAYPGIRQNLLRLAHIAATDMDFVEESYRDFAERFIERVEDEIRINRHEFTHLHEAIRRHCIMREVSRLIDDQQISFVHVQNALEMIKNGKMGSIAEFPNAVHLRIDYEHLVVERAQHGELAHKSDIPLLESAQQVNVNPDGETNIQGRQWTLTIVETEDVDVEFGIKLYVPKNASFLLRTRRPGDRFAPKGIGGHHQTVKDWMINRKVPQLVRDRIPILEINGEIALIMYDDRWALSEKFIAPQELTRRVHIFIKFL